MRSILLSFTLAAIIGTLNAQAPLGFSFQTIIRDSEGKVQKNHSVSLRFSILEGSESGSSIYSESHSKTTNEFGVINLTVGTGTPLSGSFSSIVWGSNIHFLKTEIDLAGGSSYSISTTSQLMSVPYAMYAQIAENLSGTNGLPGQELTIDENGIPNWTGFAFPSVSTLSASIVTSTTATIEIDITNDGGQYVYSKGIVFGTLNNPTLENFSKQAGNGTGLFSLTIDNLLPNTTYYARGFGTNSKGTGYGSSISFLTNPPSIPVLITNNVISVTQNSAISGGVITDDGGSSITARGVVWSTSQNPTILDNKTVDGADSGNFNSNLTELSPNTTYYIRAYAINEIGTSYGNQISFKTEELSVPLLSTISVINISQTSATSGGTIIKNGGTNIISKGVVWGINPNPDLSDNSTNEGGGDSSFNSILNGLIEGTTYYVRSYAINNSGIGFGNQLSFVKSSTEIRFNNSANIYGGSNDERPYSIQQTFDGGYIIAGQTYSNNGEFTDYNNGGNDVLVLKLNPDGTKQWDKIYGGSGWDISYDIQQAMDGSYILTGSSTSSNGDITDGNYGIHDVLVLKLNPDGTKQWDKTYGGSSSEIGFSIEQTNEGGYIVAGYTWSYNGDVSVVEGSGPSWIIKLNPDGTKQWDKPLDFDNRSGGSEELKSIHQTSDGGYIAVGFTNVAPVDLIKNNGGFDFLIFRLNPDGTKQWVKFFGGSGNDYANSMVETFDGSYIITGTTNSSNGDITDGNNGSDDIWVIKIDSEGNKIWDRTFGGSNYDFAKSIQQTNDGGYIIAGYTLSNDGDITDGNNGSEDIWVIKIDSEGNKIWDRTFGGSRHDGANSIQQTSDGGYIIAGYTLSNDGDITDGNNGKFDVWILKLNANGEIE
jgi:hypothetical protein